MNKIAVYTAIFGEKDQLKDPLLFQNDPNIDYYLFTDNLEASSKIYKIKYKVPFFDDITKNARYYKVLGANELKEYDFTIWHDGNLQIFHNLIHDLVDCVGENSLATFQHPFRNCIYREAIACIKREKDNPVKIFNQIFRYFKNGMPPRNGLFETSILIKKNSQNLDKFLNFWWNEIYRETRRDQISLAYSIWKFKVTISSIPGCREINNYSKFENHLYSGYSYKGSSQKKKVRPIKYFFILLISSLRVIAKIFVS